MAKCLLNITNRITLDDVVIRVSDEEAHKLVKAGTHKYIPKSIYRDALMKAAAAKLTPVVNLWDDKG